jgi:hypothetical protein
MDIQRELQRIIDQAAKESIRKPEEKLPDFKWEYVISVDLGRVDNSVISVIEIYSEEPITTYKLADMVVLPKGLDYVQQAQFIVDYLGKPHFKTWDYKLLIDVTGLGEPVSDLIRAIHKIEHRKIRITSGDSKKGMRYSRNFLIRNVKKWIDSEKFIIPERLKELPGLIEELTALKPVYKEDGSIIFKSDLNDDRVMSLAMALGHLEMRSKVKVRARKIRWHRGRAWFED